MLLMVVGAWDRALVVGLCLAGMIVVGIVVGAIMGDY